MGIFSNDATWLAEDKHMVARSSKLLATDGGAHIYDVINKLNDMEQGMNIVVKNHTVEKDGYQLRECEFAKKGDKIAFVCDVPLIYEDYRKADQFEYKFINKKGKRTRAYELKVDDVFGVSDYGFTTLVDGGKGVQLGKYVVVDEAGKYKELDAEPSHAEYGFIGVVVGFERYQYDTIVLVEVIKNQKVTA